MKTLFAVILLVFVADQSIAQDISITFSAKGEASTIDSIIALNQRTSQSVTLPGTAVLLLRLGLGLQEDRVRTTGLNVFPNPFSDECTLRVTVDHPQNVQLSLCNIMGQVIAKTHKYVQGGINDFGCAINEEGIYHIMIKTEESTSGYKVMCIDPAGKSNRIDYKGMSPIFTGNSEFLSLKSDNPVYALAYSKGDILNYTCFSGTMATIVIDTIPESKEMNVLFAECTDPEGKHYKTVTIGNQAWMAENLAYLPSVSIPKSGSETSPFYYVYGYDGTSLSAAKGTANNTTYGVLYNWEAATSACPAGWHLPSDEEWKILEKHLGMSEWDANRWGWRAAGNVGGKLKESGTTHWVSQIDQGSNISGFSALPGGYLHYQAGFYGLGSEAYYWSSTETGLSSAYYRTLSRYDDVSRVYSTRGKGLSVRCLHNQAAINAQPKAFINIHPNSGDTLTVFQFEASGSTDLETSASQLQVRWDFENDGTWDTDYSTVKTETHQYHMAGNYFVLLEAKDAGGLTDTDTHQVLVSSGGMVGDDYFDYEGRRYKFKTIGTQTWMIENLAYLPAVSFSESGNGLSPYYYVYDYEGTSAIDAKGTAQYARYGVLYNWEAAKTACPSGWHLPSDQEWMILEKYLGMAEDDANSAGWRYSGSVGGKLKESGTSHWSNPNTNGTNSSGFTAMPGGFRHGSGGFNGLGSDAYFWSSSENGSLYSWYRFLPYDSGGVMRNNGDRADGLSVRCLRNN